jgi:hypothetical protein
MRRRMRLFSPSDSNHKSPHATFYIQTPSIYSQVVYHILPERNPVSNVSLQRSTKCQDHDTCTQHVSPARCSDRSCSTLGRRTRRASLLAGKVVESKREETTAKLSIVARTRKRAVRLGQLRRQSREIVAAPAPVNRNQYLSLTSLPSLTQNVLLGIFQASKLVV